MRVLYRDPKGYKLKLFIDNPDDLWHLFNVLEKGDMVGALSTRRDETGRDKLRQERGEKKKMWLEVEVTEVEFADFADRLRVSGIIKEGPQDLGSHHTLNLEIGLEVSITKEWKDHQIDIIREAMQATKTPLLTFVSLDDEEATFATLHHHAVKWVATVPSHISGKDYEGRGPGKAEYFGELVATLAQIKKDGPAVILGPGFTRDEFLKFGRERNGPLFEGCHMEGTSQAGMGGIYEMMKRDIVSRFIQESRVAQETAQVEALLTEIAKDGRCAYGKDEVKHALDEGAVLVLLVTDELMRKGQAERLFHLAKSTNARYMVISTAHEAGKRLAHLGGAGAILRYKLEYG